MTNNIKNAFLCGFIFTRSTNLQRTYIFHIQSEKLIKKLICATHMMMSIFVQLFVYIAVINDISKIQIISFCISHT